MPDFRNLFGDILTGMAGTTQPSQAQSLGMPQAAGLTPQQLQELMMMPVRKSLEEYRNESLAVQRDKIKTQGGNSAMAGLTDEEQLALAHGISRDNNPLMLSDIKTRGIGPKIAAMALMKDPDWDPTVAAMGRGKRVAKATGEGGVQGKQGQLIGSAAGSMEDMLDKASVLIPTVSPSKAKIVNQALQAGLEQVNDPSLMELYGYLTSAAGFYASLQKNGGVPDSVETKAAMKVINSHLNKSGFEGMAKALRNEAQSRVYRIQGKGFEEKPFDRQKQTDKPKPNHAALLDKYGVP